MPIVWREQISVGNDIIDQDHKYLICLVNSVELSLKHDDTLEYLPIFIQQLVTYTSEHFAREESIQKKALYPFLNEHKRKHTEILDKLSGLVKLVDDFIEKKQNDVLEFGQEDELTQQIMELVRLWILDHLLKEDKRMEHYLRKLPRSFC